MATPYFVSSSSSSSATLSRKYAVGLSFAGQDVRKGFVDNLDDAIRRIGISIFKDDIELERGRKIYEGIQEGIERSWSFIVVFSENYAASTDCLDELVMILERMKQEKLFRVFPVFYHVNPTDVQKLTGAYGAAFAKHDQEFASCPLKVAKWRVAVMEVAEVSGWELLRNANESHFIQGIVQEIKRHSMRIQSAVAIEVTCCGMTAGIYEQCPQETSNIRTEIKRLCCLLFLPHLFISIFIFVFVLLILWIVFSRNDGSACTCACPYPCAPAPI